MYIEKKEAKSLNIETVKNILIEMAQSAIKNNYATKRQRDEMKEALLPENEHMVNGFARQLVDLNEALLNGASVFAICVKEPRGNLDSGKHYYSIHYTKDNQVNKFWARGFTYLCGCEIQERDRNLDKFIFGSGAIGMSRLLDATDGVFNLLKKLGGCYTQIDCK